MIKRSSDDFTVMKYCSENFYILANKKYIKDIIYILKPKFTNSELCLIKLSNTE